MIDKCNIMHGIGVAISLTVAIFMNKMFGLRIEGWVVAAMLMSLSTFFSFVPKEKQKISKALLGMVFSGIIVAVLFFAVDKWNL